MKKHWKWLVPVLLLVAALAGWRWYTRPLTLEQLTPDFNWDEIVSMAGSYSPSIYEDFVQTDYISMEDDPQIPILVQSLRETTLRRDWAQQRYYALSDNGPFDAKLYLKEENGALYLTLYKDFLTVQLYDVNGPRRELVCSLTHQSPNWQDWVAFTDAHRK